MSESKLYFWDQEKEENKKVSINTQKNEDLEAKKFSVDEYKDQVISTNKTEDVEKKVSKNMPPTIDVFMDKYELIQNKKYSYLDDKKKKKKASKSPSWFYMRPLLNKLKDLQDILNKEINFKDATKVQNAFLDCCDKCEKYLDKRKNPRSPEGKARRAMIEDFYKQIRDESIQFSERLNELTQNKKDELVEQKKKWTDILKEIRCKNFEAGKDGCKIMMGGAGTSDVYIMHKDEKWQFFKESENIPSDDYHVTIDEQRTVIDVYDKEYLDSHKNLSEKDKQTHNESMQKRRTFLLLLQSYFDSKFANNPDGVGYFIKEGLGEKKDDFSLIAFLKINCNNENHTELSNLLGKVIMEYSNLTSDYDKANDKYKATQNADDRKLLEECKEKVLNSDLMFMSNALQKIKKNQTSNHISRNVAYIKKDAELSKRNVATSRLAGFLGLSDLIVQTEMTNVTVNGKMMQGIIMDQAQGRNIGSIKSMAKKAGKNVRYTGNSLKGLCNLQILDILCGQVDRHSGNYMMTYTIDGNGDYCYDKVTGIDNDMSFGCLGYNEIFGKGEKGYHEIRNIGDFNGIKIPGIDADLAQRIINLKPEFIEYQMLDILDKTERYYLIDRLKGLQQTLRNQLRIEKQFRNSNERFTSKFVSGAEGWNNRLKYYKKIVETTARKNKVEAQKFEGYTYIKNEYLL